MNEYQTILKMFEYHVFDKLYGKQYGCDWTIVLHYTSTNESNPYIRRNHE
jgi:hypothetical protein